MLYCCTKVKLNHSMCKHPEHLECLDRKFMSFRVRSDSPVRERFLHYTQYTSSGPQVCRCYITRRLTRHMNKYLPPVHEPIVFALTVLLAGTGSAPSC